MTESKYICPRCKKEFRHYVPRKCECGYEYKSATNSDVGNIATVFGLLLAFVPCVVALSIKNGDPGSLRLFLGLLNLICSVVSAGFLVRNIRNNRGVIGFFLGFGF